MSIKPSVVFIKGVHSITGHDTDSDIGFPQLELEKLFEGAIIKETTDTAYDSNKKYIHYDSLNSQVAIQDTGHFNCIKNGYYSVANGINHYYTKSGDNYSYNAVPSNVNTWVGKWSFSNTIKSKDLYSISSESDRICVNGIYYKKNGNDYVKQDVTTYNTYDDSIYVNWNNEYIGETTLDEHFHNVTVWKTKNGTIATSGYYLSIDDKPNGTYIVQLLNLTFDAKGVYSGDIIFDGLYKLPSDFNFQDSVTYYLKNGNNFEGLKVNQGQCTFTTDPTTDNNFYIYQKGADGKTVVHNLNVVCDGAANGDNTCAFSASNPENLILYDCSATYRTYTEIVNRSLFAGCTCYNCSYAFQNLSATSSISMKVFYQCRCYNCKCKQTIEANSSTGISFNSDSYFYMECHCSSCDAELTTSRNIKAATKTFACYYNCYDRCVGCLSKINVNSKAVTVYSTLYGFFRCQYMSSCKEIHTESYTNIKGIVQCDFISSTSGINESSNTHVGNSCSIQ